MSEQLKQNIDRITDLESAGYNLVAALDEAFRGEMIVVKTDEQKRHLLSLIVAHGRLREVVKK